MTALVLELRQGDLMILNGTPIRFRTKSRIELTEKANFLFGKQILRPDDANSPARRIYFAFQTVYIGTDAERAVALETAQGLVAEFKSATTSNLAREILDTAMACASSDRYYDALKLARRIMNHETAVLQANQ
ncbi:MAG: flagellar biosynthesis repressor FlbT [Acidiphilium sp. 21-60-14]|nr:MAG: flagellar biosynthesis repressor FlbT [Acidiphilium sp. 21-60-14]HQU24038.1 flagellar biosynthesis repressor FlbT [Acidiphilium sp.]